MEHRNSLLEICALGPKHVHSEDEPLQLASFDFSYPEELVAQSPATERDAARLLVRHRDGRCEHAGVRDLAELLPRGSLLIVNDSRVIASRLFGRLPTGGKVELFLLAPVGGKDTLQGACTWRALGRPLRKLKPGTTVHLSESCEARVQRRNENGESVVLEFNLEPPAFSQWLERNGYVPLPPYIKRDTPQPKPNSPDRDRYQTVYARKEGSVAAPTAGLHLSETVLETLRAKEIEQATVSLHVGGGTFLPVKTDDPAGHTMHEESFWIPGDTMEKLAAARAAGRPAVAVGTTTFRALESVHLWAEVQGNQPREWAERWLSTDLFLYPKTAGDRHNPRSVDALFTNFHQPQSTLFMLVCALIGWREAHELYRGAVEQRYRLFSYGDASLLWL